MDEKHLVHNNPLLLCDGPLGSLKAHVNRESKVPPRGPRYAYLGTNQTPNSQAPNHGLARERPRFVGRLNLGMDPRPKRKLVVGNWGLTMNDYRRLHFPSQGSKLERI